jgi:preprotein translocase subunit YajC
MLIMMTIIVLIMMMIMMMIIMPIMIMSTSQYRETTHSLNSVVKASPLATGS